MYVLLEYMHLVNYVIIFVAIRFILGRFCIVIMIIDGSYIIRCNHGLLYLLIILYDTDLYWGI